jgi:hypothetical protein
MEDKTTIEDIFYSALSNIQYDYGMEYDKATNFRGIEMQTTFIIDAKEYELTVKAM